MKKKTRSKSAKAPAARSTPRHASGAGRKPARRATAASAAKPAPRKAPARATAPPRLAAPAAAATSGRDKYSQPGAPWWKAHL